MIIDVYISFDTEFPMVALKKFEVDNNALIGPDEVRMGRELTADIRVIHM